MLETDVPETANEMIMSTRKGGSCGVIAVYAGLTNNFNIGALMEKGIRFIGNGQVSYHTHIPYRLCISCADTSFTPPGAGTSM